MVVMAEDMAVTVVTVVLILPVLVAMEVIGVMEVLEDIRVVLARPRSQVEEALEGKIPCKC